MKKILFVLLCITVLTVSCNIEFPETINLKGSPEFYIPFGNPLKNMQSSGDMDIFELVSQEKIMEMIGDTGINIYIYEDEDSDTMAFLLHHPIIEMELNLDEYLVDMEIEQNFTFEIPKLIGEYEDIRAQYPFLGLPEFPNTGICLTDDLLSLDLQGLPTLMATDHSSCTCEPLFTIDLTDMARLIVEIEGEISIEISGVDFTDSLALQLRIPALGITDYENGDYDIVNEKLKFSNQNLNREFRPRDHLDEGLFKIYAKIMSPVSGEISPGINLDWQAVTVDTSAEGSFDGQIEIENFLGEFDAYFGTVELAQVDGFIFVGGIDGMTASLVLEANNVSLITGDNAITNVEERPVFNGVITEIPEHSLETHIDFTEILNSEGHTDLKYAIQIEQFRIEKNDLIDGRLLFADMAILLSLEFRIKNELDYDRYGSEYEDDLQEFVKIDLGGVFDDLIGDSDIFMRDQDQGIGDLLKNLDWVKISFKNFNNNFISDNLAFMIAYKDPDTDLLIPHFIDLSETSPSIHIKYEELPMPFIPEIEILLKKEDKNHEHATLKILNQKSGEDPALDFFLTIEVKANLDIDIPL
jgi:hypothetical protein